MLCAEWLDVWTERLREWLATRVLRELVDAVEGAHVVINEVIEMTGRLPKPHVPFARQVVGISSNGDGVNHDLGHETMQLQRHMHAMVHTGCGMA